MVECSECWGKLFTEAKTQHNCYSKAKMSLTNRKFCSDKFHQNFVNRTVSEKTILAAEQLSQIRQITGCAILQESIKSQIKAKDRRFQTSLIENSFCGSTADFCWFTSEWEDNYQCLTLSQSILNLLLSILYAISHIYSQIVNSDWMNALFAF